MNTIKTLFLSALLSAAAYGVYVAVTGVSPLNFSAHKEPAKDWETGPQVVLSDDQGEEAAAPSMTSPADTLPATTDLAHTAQPAATPVQALAAPHDDLNAAAPLGQNSLTGPPDASHGPYGAADPYGSIESDATAGRYPPANRYPPERRYPPESRYPSTGEDQPPGASAYGDTLAANTEGDIHAQFAALLQSAEASLAQGQLAEVHLELSAWYGEPRLAPEEEHQLTNLLDQLAGTVIYSRQHLLEPAYEVQPGDTLERIADDYQVPWQLLANINGLRDPQHLRQGEQLKVIRGPFHAVVDLQKFELVLNVGRRYAGRFAIGLGGKQQTPEGDYVVLKKVLNPTYYGDTVIDANDPNNPLGEFALDLGNQVMIHGTNDPQTIGRAGSRGCISLADRDMKDVFDILVAKSEHCPGSMIKIRFNPADDTEPSAVPSEPAVARLPGGR